ncbi:MAG: peptide chain release factor-like protein [Planctomycetota bacterium]|nr:peptide chain release factor-like protein [Planctomycetota bacterium]
MNLQEPWDVRPEKRTQLIERIERLKIDPNMIEEQFVRGGGPGGQKINKTASCVVLHYPPLKIRVRCQKDRRRSINRFLALRELVDRIEKIVSPETARSSDQSDRRRQNRLRRKRRSRKKAQKTESDDSILEKPSPDENVDEIRSPDHPSD